MLTEQRQNSETQGTELEDPHVRNIIVIAYYNKGRQPKAGDTLNVKKIQRANTSMAEIETQNTKIQMFKSYSKQLFPTLELIIIRKFAFGIVRAVNT